MTEHLKKLLKWEQFLLTWRTYALFEGPAASAADLSSKTARKKIKTHSKY